MTKSRPIVLTSHARPGSNHFSPIHWGAEDSHNRGPLIGSVSDPMHRNVIGTHSGSYSVYRAVSVAAGLLDPTHVADLTNTSLLEAAVKWFTPLILSTGMSTLDEIERASRILKNSKCP